MKAPWPEDFGRIARQRRLDLNLSQDDLAERVGVTRQWLSRFESAKSEVSLSKALLVLRELELDVDVTAEPQPATAAMPFFVPDLVTRTVSSINDDVLDDMVDNLRRSMSRSGLSETAVSALDALTQNPSYRRAMARLTASMTTSLDGADAPAQLDDGETP